MPSEIIDYRWLEVKVWIEMKLLAEIKYYSYRKCYSSVVSLKLNYFRHEI